MLTSALYSIRHCTTSSRPQVQAKWSGEHPSLRKHTCTCTFNYINFHIHISRCKTKTLLVFFLQCSFTKYVCINDLSSKIFFINKIVISALKIICSIFSFPVWIHMTFHSSFLQYFIEMLIEKFPNISKSWALPCLILSLSIQSGSAWTVLIAATDKQKNKALKFTYRTLT